MKKIRTDVISMLAMSIWTKICVIKISLKQINNGVYELNPMTLILKMPNSETS